MASSIQLLRSTIAQERPFPGNLLDGQPAVNLNSTEPGLFFKAADGSLVKFGPAAITSDGSPPNSSPQGSSGNTVGELWLDKSTDPAVLKVYDGTDWIDAGSGGGGGGGGAGSFIRWIYTAIGGETSLSGSSGGVLLDYTPGLEEVFVNGVLITRGTDYSAINGSSITNLSPLTAGDVVTVTSMNPLEIVQLPGQVTLLRWTVLASAGQTVLSGIDSSTQQLAYTAGFEEVYVNGTFLRRGLDYTATNGSSITLSSPLALDDEVTVMAWSPIEIGSLSVDTEDIVDEAVTTAKIDDDAVTNAKVSPVAAISSSKLLFSPGSSTSGAVDRSVESKLRDFVNVKDFGAVGDFIVGGAINPSPTDNLAAFNAALSVSNKIFVPAGYYYLSNSLVPPRFAQIIGDDKRATHMISGSAVAVMSVPLGNDVVTVSNIRFDSTTKCAGVFFGNPSGADFSTGNTFINCTFGDTLSYTVIDKAQRLTFKDCFIGAPIYLLDGNYLTVDGGAFVWNSLPTAQSKIAGITFGPTGSAYFNVAGVRVDSGQGQLINNVWFEHMPSCALYFGPVVTGFTISNSKFERCSNSPSSQSSIGLGWYVQVPDGSNVLQGGVISGNTVIGNVGKYSDGSSFTPDCLGFLGGAGIRKCSLMGNSIGFFESAKAPVGGYRVSEYRPSFSDAFADGSFANSGAFSILPSPANGKTGVFAARAGSTQTFVDSTFSKVIASTKDYDVNDWYIAASGLSRFNPKVKGYYRITAAVWLDTIADGAQILLILYKNGVLFRTLAKLNNGANSDVIITGSASFEANGTTDYFEVFLKQTSGGPVSTIATTDAVRLEGELLTY